MNLYDEGSRLDLSSDKSSYPYVDELIHNIWFRGAAIPRNAENKRIIT